jgi:glutamine synthetase
LKKRSVFEKAGVFPEGMIDHVIARLHSYSDENLSERIFGNQEAIRDLVLKYIHVK